MPQNNNELIRVLTIRDDFNEYNDELYESFFDDSGQLLPLPEQKAAVVVQCHRMIRYLKDIINDYKENEEHVEFEEGQAE